MEADILQIDHNNQVQWSGQLEENRANYAVMEIRTPDSISYDSQDYAENWKKKQFIQANLAKKIVYTW